MEEMFKLLHTMFGDSIEVRKASDLEKTIPDMLSNDYRDRLKAEYRQTLIRYHKLCDFLNKLERGETTANCPVTLLVREHNIMSDYLDVLRERAMIEKICLTD